MMPNVENALCLPYVCSDLCSVSFHHVRKHTDLLGTAGLVVGVGTPFLGFLEPKVGGEGAERLK